MDLKDNIVHEAQKLFSLNGFLSTGINDIISAAGTSKGGFYNHFASKDDLFFAVLEESQSIWRAKVLHSIEELDQPTQKIIKILINYRERYLKDSTNFPGGCIFITFSVELDDTRPQLMKAVSNGFDGFKGMLTSFVNEAIEQGEFPEGLKPETIAESLFAGMLGASVLYGASKDNDCLDNSIDSLIEYVYLLGNTQMPNSDKPGKSN